MVSETTIKQMMQQFQWFTEIICHNTTEHLKCPVEITCKATLLQHFLPNHIVYILEFIVEGEIGKSKKTKNKINICLLMVFFIAILVGAIPHLLVSYCHKLALQKKKKKNVMSSCMLQTKWGPTCKNIATISGQISTGYL